MRLLLHAPPAGSALTLTPGGVYVEHCQALLARSANLAMARLRCGPGGPGADHCPRATGTLLLGRIWPSFAPLYPEVVLELTLA